MALFDDLSVYVRGTLLWAVSSCPLFALAFAVIVPFSGSIAAATAEVLWPLLLAAASVLMLPTPGAVALGGLARTSTAGETPAWPGLRVALRGSWSLGLRLWAVGFVGAILLWANLTFYASAFEGWPRLTSIVWGYALLAWLGVQVWLVPLYLRGRRASLVGLYRRAGALALGFPFLTLGLLLLAFLTLLVSALVPPLGLLMGAAYVQLGQARAFRTLRVRLGDLVPGEDTDGSGHLPLLGDDGR